MLTIYNDRHVLHHGKLEMFRGELVPCFEVPARADYVFGELQRRQLGAIESPHGDPHTENPYYLGHADERGAGAGLGYNLNLPLPRGTGFEAWRAALQQALGAIAAHGVEALLVSLGVDTIEGDPISGFGLKSDDYLQVGQDLAAAGLPTVFVFEGGYAVAEVGVNAVNVLAGFDRGAG